MGRAKIAITIEPGLLGEIDSLVARRVYDNRSQAIEEAVKDKLERLSRGRLAQECALLDPAFEKSMAEEGLTREIDQWPEY